MLLVVLSGAIALLCIAGVYVVLCCCFPLDDVKHSNPGASAPQNPTPGPSSMVNMAFKDDDGSGGNEEVITQDWLCEVRV